MHNQMKKLIEERVDRGIEWLDENYQFWREDIDIVTLHMSGCSTCIIGQLFGNFKEILYKHPEINPVTHGFEIEDILRYDYSDLQEVWIDKLVS